MLFYTIGALRGLTAETHSTTATAKISVFNLDDKTSKELADANDPGTATYLAAYYDSVRNCYHVLYQKQATADKKKIYDFQDSKTTACEFSISVLPIHDL